ncbi:response regulator [Brevundimonas vesicularis]|uniref:response regulator transcription factor n=1 Tax=Brevundimonas vesicularis TaxID=41276 RepID=UPI0028A99995|nr:response regulator [Brevundimonas vesicularis]
MTNHPVFVIEDDPGMRDSLVTLLRLNGLQVRGFQSGEDFFDRLPDVPSACVVTDLRMPGITGADVVRRLKELRNGVWLVIVLTGHADVPIAVQLMKDGIVDFIEKPFDPERLLESLRGCASLLTNLRADRTDKEQVDERFRRLTPRERQVFDALVKGGTNRTIGGDLGLSPRTVEIFRSKIMKKMGATSVVELVQTSVKHGL